MGSYTRALYYTILYYTILYYTIVEKLSIQWWSERNFANFKNCRKFLKLYTVIAELIANDN
jgi:hypothetical protein